MSSELPQSEVNSQVKNELPKPSKRFKTKHMIMIIDHALISLLMSLSCIIGWYFLGLGMNVIWHWMPTLFCLLISRLLLHFSPLSYAEVTSDVQFTFDLLLCTIIVLSNILECAGAFESVWWINLEVRCHVYFAYIAIRCLFVIGFTAFKKQKKQTDSTV
ncbi:hypothetical protein M3Y94_01251200 [Aphelenchoides besseyi]|nr:hypothetical protein M3Y94_01251200 [Aphelenchoides besseyi]